MVNYSSAGSKVDNKEELGKELNEVQIETDNLGVILRADTLGTLEALCRIFKEEDILRAGYHYQKNTDWHKKRPDIV